jgi:hypothetical protein
MKSFVFQALYANLAINKVCHCQMRLRLPFRRFSSFPAPIPDLEEIDDYATEIALQRLKQFSLFDAELYLRQNLDVKNAGDDPYAHFLRHGFRESHRQVRDICQIAKSVGRVSQSTLAFNSSLLSPTSICDSLPIGKVEILCSSRGNSFMLPLAKHLADGLTRCGADVFLRDEYSEPDNEIDYRIVVAPHEFFYQGRAGKWSSQDLISNMVMLSTEQIQTKWYWESLPYLLMSRGVIDLFHHSMMLLNESGIPAIYYAPNPATRKVLTLPDRLPGHPLFRVLPEKARLPHDPSLPYKDRAIDVSFFGTSSHHRDQALARCAPYFSSLESFIYYRQIIRGPMEREDRILSSLAEHVSGHSKICLNIHRDDFRPFEWHRIVELGMCSGALVVSEPCLRVPGFIPGEHYIEVDIRNMGEMVDWLLRDEDGQEEAERIRNSAARLLADSYSANESARQVASFLCQLS